MGLLDKIFKKKNKDVLNEPVDIEPKIPQSTFLPPEPQQVDSNKAIMDTVKVKLDLVLTEIDNLKTQNQMINERLKLIERKLDEKPIRYI